MVALTKPQLRHQAETLALRHLTTGTVSMNKETGQGTQSWTPLDCRIYRRGQGITSCPTQPREPNTKKFDERHSGTPIS